MTSQDKAPVIQADRIAASEITDLVVTALSEAEGPGFSIDEVAEIIARARITREAELSRRLGEAELRVLAELEAAVERRLNRIHPLNSRANLPVTMKLEFQLTDWLRLLATLTLIREGEQQ